MTIRQRLQSLVAKVQEDPRGAFERVWGRALAQWELRGCRGVRGAVALGRVRVSNLGLIELGDSVTFLGGMIPTELRVGEGAVLRIGAESVLNYGASIEARLSVTLGRRVMVASFVRIGDGDDGRRAPVTIGNDVWLAHGAIVLPGVTIGDGSVISAGSVVTQDVPPRMMAMGNPARHMSLELSAGA